MNIFVDTGAFYALADSTDTHHPSASAFYASAQKENRFFTSMFVFVESWLLIRNRLGYGAAQSYSRAIRKGIVGLVDVSLPDLDLALSIQNDFADQEFSVVDAVSFAVMERLGISAAFSFDTHFRVYRHGPNKGFGITVLP